MKFQNKLFLFGFLLVLSFSTTFISAYISSCDMADFNQDGMIDVGDLGMLSANSGRTDCSNSNNWCDNVDINGDGKVDVSELSIFSAAGYGTNCTDVDAQYPKEEESSWCYGADINQDGVVGESSDLEILQGHYGNNNCSNQDCENSDINQDGKVDVSDLGMLAARYGENNCKLIFEEKNNTEENKTIENETLEIFPIFSNYSDNNGTLIGSGIAIFNVTVLDTNGTVWLSINNTNYSAEEIMNNIYTVNVSLNNSGEYNYIWYAYGNNTNTTLKGSDERIYVIGTNSSSSGENEGSSGSSSSTRSSSNSGTCSYNEDYDWGCSEWSDCSNGTQTRTCKTYNNCGTVYGKPNTEQTCEIIIPEVNTEPLNQTEVTTPSTFSRITGNVIGGLTSATGLVIIFFIIAVAGAYIVVRYVRKKKTGKKN
jgi:hypothetical protein